MTHKLGKNVLKAICMAAMCLNHIAHWFFPYGSVAWIACTYLGWVTAPCMCWFLVQGFWYSRDRRRYGARLFIFALVSQAPFALYFATPWQVNMIGTLFLCFLILCVRHSELDRGMSWFLQALLFIATAACDWPYVAALAVILFDWSRSMGVTARGHGRCDGAMFAAVALATLFLNLAGAESPEWHACLSLAGPSVAGLLVVLCLDPSKRVPDGRHGIASKYFFYAFYPAHLLFLYFIRSAIGL